MSRALPFLLSAAFLATPAFAAEPQATPPAAPAATADAGGEIVVTGTRRREDDVLGNVSVLGGADLAADVRPTIGETLARQPGVSASGSGPNVAKPVLRGLSGDRIRILVDGIGSLDVSSSSSDHAVAINPLTADSIEVLHGPAALLFGSSAIGGVVNVIDSRIPRRVPEGGIGVAGMAGYGTAANERLASGRLDVGLGSKLVAHGDIGWTKSDDLRTGGHILSKPLRDQARASADPEIRSLADLTGDLPNSDGKTFEAAGALAYVDGGLNIGASVTRHTAFYGVPIRYSLDPAIEAEATHIDVGQTRYDARAEVPLSGAFEKLRVRGGYSDYQHKEIAEDGAVGSQVFSKGGEARADLVQRDSNGWGGVSGIQHLDIRQRIEGDELYLPPVHAQDWGLFTVQHVDAGRLRLEGGARLETARRSARANPVIGNPDLSRRFTSLSLSAGARADLSNGWKAGLSIARSARAPSVDELFANGPHGGNASFEVGNPDLDLERSLGVEANISHRSRIVDLSATLYTSRYSNFLFQAPTGVIEDDLPLYETRQGRARYSGFELTADAKLGTLGGIAWSAEAGADATRATIKGFGPAPLIPPLRLTGGIKGKRGGVEGRIEAEHALAHSRTAPLELRTDGYTLVNAGLDWTPLSDRPELTLGLAANNIFDVVARRSTSLLKDYAPLAGRDLRLSLRLAY